jgi:hypothetical protein
MNRVTARRVSGTPKTKRKMRAAWPDVRGNFMVLPLSGVAEGLQLRRGFCWEL